MNITESLIVLNAVTSWGLESLRKVLSPKEEIPFLKMKDMISLDSVIQNLSPQKASIKRKLQAFSDSFDLEREMKESQEKGIHIIPFFDSRYPQNLLNIHNPPLLLYVNGSMDLNENISIAVVGSRKATHKGRSFAFKTSAELASYGISVISGLAYGIDAEAHRGSLSNSGKTAAVLGSGLLKVYPKEHKDLSEKISEKGALISEFPLYTDPFPSHFPRRNRIISGLSEGVLIVEAAEKSGSLITARLACEQGKDVFSVPGSPFDRNSQGTNALIKDGAKLTTETDDIISELSFRGFFCSLPLQQGAEAPWKTDVSLSEQEKDLLSVLSIDPVSLQTISSQSHMDCKNVSHILLTLELKKYIKVYPGNRYGLNYRR